MDKLNCFKAYDIRGQLETELNTDIAYRIGRAFALHSNLKNVVVGGDIRLTSEELKLALSEGLMDSGANVIDLGMTGTEEIYFATKDLKVDGGVEVTASHNPMNYNGMKLVIEDAKPISGDTGLFAIQKLAEENNFPEVVSKGKLIQQSNLTEYVDHLMTYIEPQKIKPLKLVVNSGNGAAGHVIDEIEQRFSMLNIPIEFIKVHHQADGNFPNGIPNPLLPECRVDTKKAVIEHKADMGIAWDGDFDRCFLFDENGDFIEGYYIVGLLAEAFLQKNPGEKIIYDPRVYWNTEDVVKQNGGIPIMSKTGHAFIKERMRTENAIYGGEMSAHHYFRDFAYCDSGMIPWLLVSELMSVKAQKLSDLVKKRISLYPSSGEINLKVDDPSKVIARIEKKYSALPEVIVDHTDGINIIFPEWRFNLRQSNTEPLIRLNIESKKRMLLMAKKTEQLINEITEKQPLEAKLLGSIDAFEDGLVRGWALDRNALSKRLRICVISDNKVIAQGVADNYRKDLDANFEEGDGKYGFIIEVADQWPLHIKEISLTITEEESGKNIIEEPKGFYLHNRIYVESMRVEHGQIITKLISSSPIYEKQVVLSHEDEIISTQVIDSPAHEVELYIPYPMSMQDGGERLFKVSITGFPNLIGMGYLSCHAIQTPWQYIKESFNKPGFLSKSEQADSRYESLNYQLENIANESCVIQPKDLMTTHRVVVEGYENRSSYPAFNLPKFDKPEVSIIVPAYNKFELTYHCIASIALAYNKTSYEVILADDCSTDETAKAETIIGNLVISRNEENLRFLRSCNQASAHAKGEYIIFLNNDTEVTSFWLDELVSPFKKSDEIGMTGAKLLNLDGTLQEAGGIVWENGEPWNVGRNLNPLTPEYNYTREVDYLTGAAMCIRTDLWELVEQFSQELVPCYYEDTDLAFKVRDAGFKTVYVPHSVVVHFEGQSHGTDVTKGLKRYQVVNEATFRQKWFKAYRNNGSPSFANLRFEKDRNVDQRVLVIDYASPMPNKDAGSYAVIQEMKLIQSLGFKVTFVPANLAHFGKYTTELQKNGIEVLYAPFYHSVNHVLETRLDEFDAVYIVRYEVAEKYIDFIKENSKAKIIFNNCDLHFLREMRAALKGETDHEALNKSLVTRSNELAVCQKADAVLCYNSTEHAVITSHILEAEKLHLTPWVLEQKSKAPDFKSRAGIAFLGGFNHTPNGEAVEYLVHEIMPLLTKKRPEIILYIYGSNMPKELKKYNSKNIKMIGFAETLEGVYHNHRVFVAPLLSGAGIKGKVLEAMAFGTPTVLTDVAAEGTGLTDGLSTLIAEEPQEWVNSILKLYDNKNLWDKFSENEKLLVENQYSFENGHKKFKDIFSSVGIYTSR